MAVTSGSESIISMLPPLCSHLVPSVFLTLSYVFSFIYSAQYKKNDSFV